MFINIVVGGAHALTEFKRRVSVRPLSRRRDRIGRSVEVRTTSSLPSLAWTSHRLVTFAGWSRLVGRCSNAPWHRVGVALLSIRDHTRIDYPKLLLPLVTQKSANNEDVKVFGCFRFDFDVNAQKGRGDRHVTDDLDSQSLLDLDWMVQNESFLRRLIEVAICSVYTTTLDVFGYSFSAQVVCCSIRTRNGTPLTSMVHLILKPDGGPIFGRPALSCVLPCVISGRRLTSADFGCTLHRPFC